ncbi:hypothetical protein D3218_16790 [Aureimonas flava]|uniref:Uncharacterized protein n=1 Tax=Aureimonas flava TaxID=2320271 RepID=A0A3A1WHM0_9HYPH|nr:hypothetical protein [Aureimonas flava]RIX98834.1 hypothetical protein D3218_16790 [Aureimonas flava]
MSSQLLLERLADELARLTAAATRLEGLIPPAGLGPEAMIVAQSHDLLSQTIAELEGFVRASAPSFAGEGERDLGEPLSAIRLSALATRLGGWTEAEVRAGDVDLF